MISIFVSVFQLTDYTDIHLDMGTFCFAMLFLVTLFLQREYHLDHMWSVLDE